MIRRADLKKFRSCTVIHCPKCGEFKFYSPPKKLLACPRCQEKQIITLPERPDIEARFKDDKHPIQ